MSAVKEVEFFSDRTSYVIGRGRFYHISFVTVLPPAKDKIEYMQDSFREALERM
jgi:hypothetical protein